MRKLLWLALMAGALGGCDYLPIGTTPVKDIVDAPAGFEGKEVKVRGTVKEVTRVPILDIRQYVLSDGSGEVAVVTSGDLPAEKSTVLVTGRVESALIVGGQSLGLHIREVARHGSL
ncbi:MAG: hypothetical protein ACM3JK_01925 [Betaproteobacteria bacterium]